MLENIDIPKVLERLKNDEDYYGDFGKQFLSNSDIYNLLRDPKKFRQPTGENINLLLGGAFHHMVLEPEKMADYEVVDASSRLTKKYKDAAAEAGKMLLLESDIDHLKEMKKTIDGNDLIQSILVGDGVEYEVPAIAEIHGELWKGKADCLNHNDRLIIDVKTTSDLNAFHLSAKRYNYDSQAYIYNQLFGYDVVFVVIDKKTLQLGFYDCSQNFYRNGKEKVDQALHAYRLFYKDQQEFDWSNYLKTETL